MTASAKGGLLRRRADNAPWGPLGDHTLCAIVNDERVYERLARTHVGPKPPATWENALPLL
jgi:hypothetical protein